MVSVGTPYRDLCKACDPLTGSLAGGFLTGGFLTGASQGHAPPWLTEVSVQGRTGRMTEGKMT